MIRRTLSDLKLMSKNISSKELSVHLRLCNEKAHRWWDLCDLVSCCWGGLLAINYMLDSFYSVQLFVSWKDCQIYWWGVVLLPYGYQRYSSLFKFKILLYDCSCITSFLRRERSYSCKSCYQLSSIQGITRET